jgi:hypothetical protein
MLQTFKSKIKVFRNKKRVRLKLIEFNEVPFKSKIFKLELLKKKKYIVIIVVREGSEILFLSKRSHLSEVNIFLCLSVNNLTEKLVLIFNKRIRRQKSGFTSVSNRVITVLYE